MERGSGLRKTARGAGLWVGICCALLTLVMASTASAAPVTYKGFTITDGKLGSWSFHNARVYLTFESDTNDVHLMQFPIDPTNPNAGTADILLNQTGVASVTIVSDEKTEHAKFAANQIFVSLDLGDTSSTPHVGGRGVGFGSFTAGGGVEPAYPLGVEDGTIDFGDAANPSSELLGLSTNLMHDNGFSGRAWVCVGFAVTLGSPCSAPNPLKTDKGDLLLSQPYQVKFSDGSVGDSLSGGFFTLVVGEHHSPDEAVVTAPAVASAPAGSAHSTSVPITYTGYVIADVIIGKERFSGAQVYLSFDSETKTAVPFSDSTSSGYINKAGKAHVTVIGRDRTVTADFAPHQLYVYFDTKNASVGFGSYAGGRSYPLSVTAHEDQPGLTENSLVGAVADIALNAADAVNYTPATATLGSDLKKPTTLSGAASSCVKFNPIGAVCSDFSPLGLETTEGRFYLFEPYSDDETVPPAVPQRFSVNWGMFWAQYQAMRLP